MSGNRIVTPDGMIPGGDGKPPRPPRLEERLDLALEHWKFKRKDEAFATALNAIAFLSMGVAGLAKSNEHLRQRLEALEKHTGMNP